MMASVQAWLDVTAGVAGDMLMGALVDAGADLDGVQAAIGAVTGGDIAVRREEVTRAGERACKIHVDIVGRGTGTRSAADLRGAIEDAGLHPVTRARALRALDLLLAAYSRGHGLAPGAVALQEIAALDVLADIVGDCEALRLLGVEAVTASPVALGSGRIRTSHGDLTVPVPAVAELTNGWPTTLPDAGAGAREPVARAPHPMADGADRHVPLGGITGGEEGVLTEGPAQLVGGDGLGELATPTGMALLRCFAESCQQRPATPVRIGVGAGGRDVPGRANVVRVLLVR